MDIFKSAHSIAHVLLASFKRTNVNSDVIWGKIQDIRRMPGFESLDLNELQAQLESDFDVYDFKATELNADNVDPWLYKTTIDEKFWTRYQTYLQVKDPTFPVQGLDDKTTQILDKCANPKTKGSWDRRGMVVGNVQSGKTANYIGLVNKAADAGYKLIIVVAGIHNTLRAQTQARVDKGFIGRKSADLIQRKPSSLKYGVGKFSLPGTRSVFSYTSTPYQGGRSSLSLKNGDFNISKARELNVPIDSENPTVLVIKKNKSILENLLLWLNQFAVENSEGVRKILNVPLLVIDDEADNASVNAGTETEVRTINRLIRTLLNLFNQNTYIGYTATPFANLFIPSTWSEELETIVKGVPFQVGEDLFPRDFIINIKPPTNYIGAKEVFGYENEHTGERHEGLDIIRLAMDQEPFFPPVINKKNKDDLPTDVPPSLKRAVQSFILTCAIRRLRGQSNSHNSMLVHVALRVAWIDRIAWLVNEILRDYKLQIKSRQGNLLSNLKSLYEEDFLPTTKSVVSNLTYNDRRIKLSSWEEVKEELNFAIQKIEVRAVHGVKNTSTLEYSRIEELNYDVYDEGLSVIAIGGSKLSRGLTLEGLSTSYYLRTTKMYDSLMQMGRWFGYRPGYVDLCRLYTTEQLVKWYRHITMATEEMRTDFDELAALNQKPTDFQLKVRTHPGMLSITSVSKMKEYEKIQVGFSGKTTQTYEFPKSKEVVQGNWSQFEHLLARLGKPKMRYTQDKEINGFIWKDVNPQLIIDFVFSYRSEQPNIRPDILSSYIKKQRDTGKLTKWTVGVSLNSQQHVLIGTGEHKEKVKTKQFPFTLGEEVIEAGLPVRNQANSFPSKYLALSRQNILDPKDRVWDLDFDKEKPTSEEINVKRSNEEKALLVIYPLDWRVAEGLPSGIPVVGWGLIFPKIQNEEKVEYAARPVQEDFDQDMHEDDDIENEE